MEALANVWTFLAVVYLNVEWKKYTRAKSNLASEEAYIKFSTKEASKMNSKPPYKPWVRVWTVHRGIIPRVPERLSIRPNWLPRSVESCVCSPYCSASSFVPLSSTEKSCMRSDWFLFPDAEWSAAYVRPPHWFECCVLIGSYFQTLCGVLRMFGHLMVPAFRHYGVLRPHWLLLPDAEWSPAYC